MGLYKRGNVWWINYFVGGRQRHESSRSPKKRDAQILLDVRKGEVREGRLRLLKKAPKFEDWAQSFVSSVEHPNTRKRYRSSIRNLLEHFCGIRLSDITADRLEEFKLKRLEGGVRGATINRDLQTFRRMANLAVRKRLLAVNPVSEMEFFEERDERRQPHILTFEEQQRLLALADPHVRILAVLLTETGLRVNREALQLTWDDIDFVNDVIRVRDSKTLAGRRNVPLSAYCKAELETWRRFPNPKSQWVFPNLRKPAVHLKDIRRSWANTLGRAGIPYFPLYNLRATFASRLSAGGAADLFVAQLMGHKTPSIIQTYAKVIDEYHSEAIHKLEALRESKMPSVLAVKPN